jgi:ABC-type hemin transport system substrate-binding protein
MPDVAGLLLDLVAPDRLAVIPERCLIPVCSTNLEVARQAQTTLPLLPRLDTPVEAVLAHRPDLVVGSVYRQSHADALDQIESRGVPVLRIENRFSSLDAVARNAQQIAVAVGEEERCEQQLRDFHRLLAVVEERIWDVQHRPGVLALAHNGERLAVMPPGAMPFELIMPAGGVPVDYPYGARPRDVIEAIIGTNPEALVLVDGFGDGLGRFSELLEHTAIDAVGTGRFRVFPVNRLYPDAGFHLAEGLDALSAWLLDRDATPAAG